MSAMLNEYGTIGMRQPFVKEAAKSLYHSPARKADFLCLDPFVALDFPAHEANSFPIVMCWH